MSLFSKTVVCAKCGAQFEVGKLSGQKVCGRCQLEETENLVVAQSERTFTEGFTRYYKDFPKKLRPKSPDIAAAIRDHDRIIAKYSLPEPLTLDDFFRAASDYREMSAEECQKFAQKLDLSAMYSMNYNTWRDNYRYGNSGFLLSHLYPGLMIDLADVFAVAYKPNISPERFLGLTLNDTAYSVALFTNDPVVPGYAITVVIGKSTSFFSFKSEKKSKEEALVEMLSTMFKNLSCPIMKTKDFKNQLKSGAVVNCGLSPDVLLALAEQADDQQGIFSGWFPTDEGLCDAMEIIMRRNGYMTDKYISETVGEEFDTDAMNFWRPYFSRCETLKKIIKL